VVLAAESETSTPRPTSNTSEGLSLAAASDAYLLQFAAVL
jgi:hypothetical protein